MPLEAGQPSEKERHANGKSKAPGGVVTVSQMDRPSSDGSAWTLFAKMPSVLEQPYTIRSHVLKPPNTAEDSRQLLKRWGVAAVNVKGCKGQGDKAIGQDSFSMARLGSGWEVFCVLDGHGADGHEPSRRCAQTMMYFLDTPTCSDLLRAGSVEEALAHAFASVQSDLELFAASSSFDLDVTGTTATVAMRGPQDRDMLWVAHVGDSKAVLFSADGDAEVLEETQDHTPVVPAELARIEEMGCEVETNKYEDGFIERRVNKKGEDGPGLCMTRSLGDTFVKEVGIIATPEVQKWSLKSRRGACLFMASDGIWEFVKPKEVARFLGEQLAKGASREKALDALLRLAQERWRKEEETYCDDITAILVPADVAPAPQLDMNHDGRTVSEVAPVPESSQRHTMTASSSSPRSIRAVVLCLLAVAVVIALREKPRLRQMLQRWYGRLLAGHSR